MSSYAESLDQAAHATSRLRAWLVDTALPLWIDRGFDPTTGGFHEALDFDANPVSAAPRRLTVQGRQIFVYAQATLRGWADCRDKVTSAFDAMVDRYRSPDGEPGFAFKVDAAGQVVDSSRDTYAKAFVILAASAYYRLTGDTQAVALADEVLAFLDESALAPRGGHLDSAPKPPELLRQNPHMHLFEALIALYEATGDAAYLGRAGEIFGYFRMRFYQPESGTIAEFFDRDWQPIDGANAVWEPGHHFEWAWLLSEYRGLTGAHTGPVADRLIEVAYAQGVTAPALIVDEVRGDGTVLKASCRHWPLTEATKAQAVRLTTDPLAAGRLAAAVDWMMERHQTGVIPGLWRDHFAADGALLSKVAPASSLYHIAMAAFVADEKIQKLAPAA